MPVIPKIILIVSIIYVCLDGIYTVYLTVKFVRYRSNPKPGMRCKFYVENKLVKGYIVSRDGFSLQIHYNGVKHERFIEQTYPA